MVSILLKDDLDVDPGPEFFFFFFGGGGGGGGGGGDNVLLYNSISINQIGLIVYFQTR